RSLVEVLEWHAGRDPGRRHILYLPGEGEPEELTYGGLLERARAVAGGLARIGVGPARPWASCSLRASNTSPPSSAPRSPAAFPCLSTRRRARARSRTISGARPAS